MKSPEEFLSELCRSSRGSVFSSAPTKSLPSLHPDLRKAANHSLTVFPVPEEARLTGRLEALIREGTSDVSRLEELAAEHSPCTWRAAVVSSRLCVVQLNGMRGLTWFAAKNDGLEHCRTLSVMRGDTAWAVFHWPEGLALRDRANALAPAVRILTDGESFPVPPSGGSTWASLSEIEAVPYWLRELAFEPPPCSPPGKAAAAPRRSPRPVSTNSFRHYEVPHRSVRSGHPSCDQAGWSGGFRVSRRR